MKRTMVAIGLAAVVALTATTAFAWGPGSGRGMGMGYGAGQGYGYGPGAAVSTLSPEQVAQIQKIQSDRYAEMAPVRNEMITKRTELQALFREPALDQAKIAAKHKEIAALQAQMQEKALAARLAVAEVLTPEQRAQMPAFGPGTGPGFGRGMGMGYGPRMGFGPRW
jgi:Spy/CpxP family protein refolding chaperone